MSIRRYNHTDHERIIELLRLNTPQYFSPTEEKDLLDFLAHHTDNYYVVEMGSVILACGGFNLTEDGETARISWDIVHPESHGKGIGSALTKFRIQKIKEIKGVSTISVRTTQLVYQYYERFGFELIEIVKDFWADGFDLYRMECDIDSINMNT